MKLYEYMVVYSEYKFTGRCKITTKFPIDNYERIEEVDAKIRSEYGYKNAFVIDFKLLREFEE